MEPLFVAEWKYDKKTIYEFLQTLYLIFDYPYKYYTFKLFEV